MPERRIETTRRRVCAAVMEINELMRRLATEVQEMGAALVDHGEALRTDMGPDLLRDGT